MDKQKQINFLGNCLYDLQEEYDMSNPFEVAKIIINAGYRKIPENAVVLTREEYDKLNMLAEECIKWRSKYCNTNEICKEITGKGVQNGK